MLKIVMQTIAAVLVFIVLWLSGNAIYFFAESNRGTPIEQQTHLIVVSIISLITVFRSASARGSFQDRIKATLISSTVMFGTYAIVILFGRYYFSRAILATFIPTALILSIGVIWARSRDKGVKTVVVTPLVKSVPAELGNVEILDDPKADFRPYDLVLVDLQAPVNAEWAAALSTAMLSGCRIRHLEDHIEDLSGAVSISHFQLEHLPSTDYDAYIQIKRLLDIGATLLIAPLAVPLILLAAGGIVLTSGWPIFFIQPRVGLGGAEFDMWKLRTMRSAMLGRDDHAAVPGDTRVTPIGRILRRTRIDELPQLWNVLKGDMSLIGPRPETVAFHRSYVAVEPKFAYRCLVRPGISGWAQVNAPPSANSYEAVFKARYDLYYIKRQSLFLDLKICIRTIWTLLHGGGAR